MAMRGLHPASRKAAPLCTATALSPRHAPPPLGEQGRSQIAQGLRLTLIIRSAGAAPTDSTARLDPLRRLVPNYCVRLHPHHIVQLAIRPALAELSVVAVAGVGQNGLRPQAPPAPAAPRKSDPGPGPSPVQRSALAPPPQTSGSSPECSVPAKTDLPPPPSRSPPAAAPAAAVLAKSRTAARPPPRLRRVGGDHLNPQLLRGPSHLRPRRRIDRPARLRRHEEVAGPIAIKGAK